MHMQEAQDNDYKIGCMFLFLLFYKTRQHAQSVEQGDHKY